MPTDIPGFGGNTGGVLAGLPSPSAWWALFHGDWKAFLRLWLDPYGLWFASRKMRSILGQRALRYVFAANVISMLGSGMNSAAVAWYILQATHSEMALGTFAVLQTVPAMLMLPFTGVIIDREDRRRLVMMLDAVRGVIIVVVAMLAFRHKVQVWQLYLMNTLVAAGFWMFWPTITALIQELTPEGAFLQSNTFLLAGVQGGWLIAGAIVGFMYNHIGLGGVLDRILILNCRESTTTIDAQKLTFGRPSSRDGR